MTTIDPALHRAGRMTGLTGVPAMLRTPSEGCRVEGRGAFPGPIAWAVRPVLAVVGLAAALALLVVVELALIMELTL